MKTIKIIDLLNMISKGEEVPKKIKYLSYEYEFNKEDKEYQRDYKGYNYGLGEDRRLDIMLDDEVEIIEEPQEHKIPEKLDYKYENIYHNISQCKQSEIPIIDKINEILDYLEEIK